MSADNGIYILESSGPEFRVVHAQAIENIHWNKKIEDDTDPDYFNMDEIKRYFGECRVFLNEQDALDEAHRIGLGYPILEYGICDIVLPRKFPK